MHVEPIQFKSRMPVEAYGEGGFTLGGLTHRGSILLLADKVEPWAPTALSEITPDHLAPLIETAAEYEFLLLGCGFSMGRPPRLVFDALKEAGLRLEYMDTGAACRLYNVLIAEDRRLAGAMIAV